MKSEVGVGGGEDGFCTLSVGRADYVYYCPACCSPCFLLLLWKPYGRPWGERSKFFLVPRAKEQCSNAQSTGSDMEGPAADEAQD